MLVPSLDSSGSDDWVTEDTTLSFTRYTARSPDGSAGREIVTKWDFGTDSWDFPSPLSESNLCLGRSAEEVDSDASLSALRAHPKYRQLYRKLVDGYAAIAQTGSSAIKPAAEKA